ncbi:uncharacterized protein JCM15063_001160 [Sporobolomyces koalae]|uniref:uncharacterized protein n=1 Tax=Sporobolomyces koalae TaxID=500713 RepID=UPI003178073E
MQTTTPDHRATRTGEPEVAPDADEEISESRAATKRLLGIGKPDPDALDRRDITARPARPPPPSQPMMAPSPASPTKPYHSVPFQAHPTARSGSPAKHATSDGSARVKGSSSSVSHPPVPPPQYTVRSQPIGLARSNSQSEIAPTISGGLARRLSVSSLSSEDDEDLNEASSRREPVNRPLLKHRSESLPSFPRLDVFGDSKEKNSGRAADAQELAQLPSNPKMWLPSHLALYLSETLSLHPALAADITAFIRNSRLSGRTFLRLKAADLEELGVNVRWRAALLEQGDQLRRESLGGRIFWGYEGGRRTEQQESQFATRSKSASALSHSARMPSQVSHRRRPSLEVEGSNSEDESSKEEWKRSWRRLNRGNNRVKGLARTFETVMETSERSVHGSPNVSPVKLPTQSPVKPSVPSDESTGQQRSFAWMREVDAERSNRARMASTDTDIGAASVESFAGRDDRPSVGASLASIDSTADHSDVFAPLPKVKSPDPSQFAPHTPNNRDNVADLRVSLAHGFDWRLYPDSPGYRQRTDSQSTDQSGLNSHEVEEAQERTLKPVRTASNASGGGSSRNFALSPASTEKRAGLADLFGLALPPTRKTTRVEPLDQDEMIEMLVKGFDDNERGTRKGSVVLIKKSQFAALQHRMEEVETQVALALESNGLHSPRKARSDQKENDVDQLEGRLIGLEHQTRLLASLSPGRGSPLHSRSYHSPLCPTQSRSTATGDEDDAFSNDGRPWWPDDSGALGWRALGGYVVAASIGIGIVAGEVVAAKLMGIRRR